MMRFILVSVSVVCSFFILGCETIGVGGDERVSCDTIRKYDIHGNIEMKIFVDGVTYDYSGNEKPKVVIVKYNTDGTIEDVYIEDDVAKLGVVNTENNYRESWLVQQREF